MDCPRCQSPADENERSCPVCHSPLELGLLQVVGGDVPRTAWVLKPRSYTIGRAVDSDITLPDSSISRLHAQLLFEDGHFTIRDEQSRNGVHVDGRRVRDARLTRRALLQLGDVTLGFSVTDPEASTGEMQVPSVHMLASRQTASLQSALDALDRLHMGIVLLGSGGTVVFANTAARASLADGALRIVEDRLVAQDERLRADLRRHMDAGDEASRGGALLVPRAGGRPLTVLVAPLGAEGARFGEQAVHALFVSDPDRGVEGSEEVLRRLYALTPAEARLVFQLLQGRTVEEAADELGVSVATARTHLRSVFSKTGTSRQSELVRLLLTGPAQVRPR